MRDRILVSYLVKSLSFSMAMMAPAFGATYNIYINGIEQGDNSTATPTVMVKDEKAAENKVEDNAAEPAVPTPQSVPPAPMESQRSKPPLIDVSHMYQRERPPLRVTLEAGVQAVGVSEDDYWGFEDEWNDDSYVDFDGAASASATATYFFTPVLGAGFMLGSLSGVEGNLLPLGSSSSFFQPELMLGYGRTGAGFGRYDNLYIGARIGLELTKSLALVATGRKSLGGDDLGSFTQIVAGISLRL